MHGYSGIPARSHPGSQDGARTSEQPAALTAWSSCGGMIHPWPANLAHPQVSRGRVSPGRFCTPLTERVRRLPAPSPTERVGRPAPSRHLGSALVFGHGRSLHLYAPTAPHVWLVLVRSFDEECISMHHQLRRGALSSSLGWGIQMFALGCTGLGSVRDRVLRRRRRSRSSRMCDGPGEVGERTSADA